MLLNISPEIINLSPGGKVILNHQTWEDYEQLLNRRQEKAAIKIRYQAQTQEISLMSPLPGHGKRIDSLSDFVKLLLRYQGRDWESFHPITLKQFKQAGIEPDSCFYLENRTAILGKERIDLAVDPPPDLAIEMDLTCATKAEDYLPFAVPELWLYRRRELLIYLFDGQAYQESQISSNFAQINVKEILPKYVELAWQSGSSTALREFEKVLSQII
jgi:Uma2 family endonuclease